MQHSYRGQPDEGRTQLLVSATMACGHGQHHQPGSAVLHAHGCMERERERELKPRQRLGQGAWVTVEQRTLMLRADSSARAWSKATRMLSLYTTLVGSAEGLICWL